MDLSLDTSFDKNDAETLLVLAVQSFIQSNASVGSIEALLKHGTTPWTASIQTKFTTFLRNKIDKLQNISKILVLLHHFVDSWSDTFIYTSLVYEESDEGGFSLLTVLMDWMLAENSQISEQSTIVVSKIWQSLSRIQFTTSWQQHPVGAWWIDADQEELLIFAKKSVQYIIKEKKEFMLQSDSFEGNSIYCSYISILSTLMQFDVCDWVSQSSQEYVSELVEILLNDCQVWKETPTNVTSTDLLKRGLHSLNLLNLLQMKLNADDLTCDFEMMVNSTSLIENILHMAFPVDESSRMLQATMCDESMLKTLKSLARNVFQSFSRGQGEAWAYVLAFERHWGIFLYNSWSRLTSDEDLDEDSMEGLLLLHKLLPLQGQSAIISTARENCNSFAERLLSLIQQNNLSTAPYAASLLRLLLGDPHDKVECTGVSRTTWESLEKCSDVLPLLVQKLSLERKNRATNHTLLLIILDLYDLTIRHTPSIRSSIGTKEIELLIDMTNTKEVDECDFGEDTPQANNLSRIIDESHIMLEEESRITTSSTQKGMDSLINIAAATVVARCGSLLASTLAPAMYSRIQRIVHECVDSFHDVHKQNTFELFRRFFRLKIVAASNTSDDEEMIAATDWKRFDYHQQELRSKDEKIESSQKEIDKLLQKIQILEQEKDHARSSIQTQAIIFQKERNRSQKFSRTETTRLIQGHLDERTKAEKKASEAVKRVELAEARQEEVKKTLTHAQEAEKELRERLETEKSRAEKFEIALREEKESNKQKHEEVAYLQSELNKCNDELRRMESEMNEAEVKIDGKESEIQQGAKAYSDLSLELDSAYDKLICLAQIYELKEEETEEKGIKMAHDFNKVKRKLQKEIQHNDDLEEKFGKIQLENERLLKKFQRAKEKLEQHKLDEEEERARRKRMGPVSYINGLHSESQRRTASSKGKENSYYSSSNRSRSKRYHLDD